MPPAATTKKPKLPFVLSDPRTVMRVQKYAAVERANKDIKENTTSNTDVVSWIQRNRWIDGAPWSFNSLGPRIEYGAHDIKSDKLARDYLLAYLRDQSPEKSVMKNRQSEMTENSINEQLFYLMTRPHTRTSHVFPTDDLGDMVSNEKIGTAIYDSPKLRSQLMQGAVRSYKFRNGSLYTIMGAYKKTGGRAGSRDIVVYDEFDLIPESIVGIYNELMSHSALRLNRFISTPTSPGVGIHKKVSEGSENEWVVKCEACNKEQIFSWPANIIGFFDLLETDRDHPNYEKHLHNVYIGCQKCGKYINRNSEHYRKTALWIPRKPNLVGIKASYYQIGLMIAWKTGKEFLRSYHDLSGYVSQFHNEKLGVAFIKGENRLAEFEVTSCQRNWRMFELRSAALTKVSLGVDWGERSSWLQVHAGNADATRPDMRCLVYAEEINETTLRSFGYGGATTDHVKRVLQVIDIFQPDIIITDGNGMGMDRAAEIIQKYPRRAWAAFFDTAEMGRQLRQSKLLIPQFTEGTKRVTFSKLNMLKEVQNEFRRGMFGFPKIVDEAAEVLRKFVHHQLGLGIQPRWSTEMDREYEIVVKFGEDHMLDANFYAKLGFDKLTGYGNSQSPGVIAKRS